LPNEEKGTFSSRSWLREEGIPEKKRKKEGNDCLDTRLELEERGRVGGKVRKREYHPINPSREEGRRGRKEGEGKWMGLEMNAPP